MKPSVTKITLCIYAAFNIQAIFDYLQLRSGTLFVMQIVDTPDATGYLFPPLLRLDVDPDRRVRDETQRPRDRPRVRLRFHCSPRCAGGALGKASADQMLRLIPDGGHQPAVGAAGQVCCMAGVSAQGAHFNLKDRPVFLGHASWKSVTIVIYIQEVIILNVAHTERI